MQGGDFKAFSRDLREPLLRGSVPFGQPRGNRADPGFDRVRDFACDLDSYRVAFPKYLCKFLQPADRVGQRFEIAACAGARSRLLRVAADFFDQLPRIVLF